MSAELPAGARAVVVTASNRASAGVYEDRSGQALAQGLRDLGFEVAGPHVRPDDHTPEQTRGVVQREIPALVAEIARYGVDHGVPTALLSRGVAGVAEQTLIVNLPGSTGGVKDALAVLGPLLPHVVSQLRGGDHPRA